MFISHFCIAAPMVRLPGTHKVHALTGSPIRSEDRLSDCIWVPSAVPAAVSRPLLLLRPGDDHPALLEQPVHVVEAVACGESHAVVGAFAMMSTCAQQGSQCEAAHYASDRLDSLLADVADELGESERDELCSVGNISARVVPHAPLVR